MVSGEFHNFRNINGDGKVFYDRGQFGSSVDGYIYIEPVGQNDTVRECSCGIVLMIMFVAGGATSFLVSQHSL